MKKNYFSKRSVINERSKWKKTENPDVWKDQFGDIRDMSSNDPTCSKNGDGFRIADVTQLTTFLPRNIAGVKYNNPYRHYGDNPNHLYIDNEKMLLFLNDRIGNLCQRDLLQRQDDKHSKKFKGAKSLFEMTGDNLLFAELQKLFCMKTCLFDPIGYHKVCENHLSLEDIAGIDSLEIVPGFLEELCLYDEFKQRPFPQIDINLLKENSDGKSSEKLNNLNFGKVGQYEVRKFLITLVSLYTCMEEKIDQKIGSFTSFTWTEGTLWFKSSEIGKQSGLVPPPLSKWGWGPEYYPVDNPCISNPPCRLCKEDHRRNKSIEQIRYWMSIHYIKEECPGYKMHPGSTKDHKTPQSHKNPEYIDRHLVYYCNIGGCPDECKCSDCVMDATDENNTQCKDHIPDHPGNFDEECHIQYPRKIFTINEVQKEFLPMKLPKMEKACQICQDNVFEHRFFHRSYHLFCNACIYMKMVSERTFENVCSYCLKVFKDKYKLKDHIGVHTELFMCQVCDKPFACNQTLKKHNQEFHEEKEEISFKCRVCDLKCSNERNLLAHEKTHLKSADINKCAMCPGEISFKQARALRRHYLSVHKIVPSHFLRPDLHQAPHHPCNICGKLFGRKDTLEQHKALESCLGFTCSFCKFCSQDELQFKAHMKSPHLKCNYCNFQTIYKRNLRRHVSIKHN